MPKKISSVLLSNQDCVCLVPLCLMYFYGVKVGACFNYHTGSFLPLSPKSRILFVVYHYLFRAHFTTLHTGCNHFRIRNKYFKRKSDQFRIRNEYLKRKSDQFRIRNKYPKRKLIFREDKLGFGLHWRLNGGFRQWMLVAKLKGTIFSDRCNW